MTVATDNLVLYLKRSKGLIIMGEINNPSSTLKE